MENSSPSQVLIETLEKFQESEPTKILIIFVNEAGKINWNSNLNRVHDTLGLLETIKMLLLKRMFQGE